MSRRKILYVTANPTKDLATDVEYRDIRAEMERGSHRDVYEFLPAQFAVTIGDLLRATNDKPYLIHFSGHCRKQGSIITDEDNNSLLLPLSELKSLLKSLQGDTQMVLFNSCSSSDQAREISELGMYVIGYNFKIGDKAAIDFAKGFYNGLGEGKSLRGAFRDGLIQLNTSNQGTKRGLGTEENKNPEIEIWKDGQKQTEQELDDTPPPLPETPNLIPRLLTTPPFVSDYFIGRDADLKVIESQFQKQNKQLFFDEWRGRDWQNYAAAQYWHSQEKFYQHLAWIFADTGVGNALLTLANKLEVSFEPKTKFEEQVETVLLALNKLNTPCLLVLDNANDANDLEKHYVQLKKLPNFYILLTTRVNELADAPIHKVLPLDETDAIALFKHHYASFNDSEEDLLKSILHAVGYNTLVIELLAKNLAVHNKFNRTAYTLSNLLHDLREKGLLEIQSRVVKVTYKSDTLRQAKPEEIIRAMYDLTGLSSFEKYLLSNFAVLPAENIPYTTLHELLKPTNEAEFGDALSLLQLKGWIEYIDSFRISPVVQTVVRDKNKGSILSNCKVLIESLIEKLGRNVIPKDNYQLATTYARYGEILLFALVVRNYQLYVLCERIGNFYEQIGNLEKAYSIFEIQHRIIQSLVESEPHNGDLKNKLGNTLGWLGSIQRDLGNLDQALTYFENSNRLQKQLSEIYPTNASYKNSLAISYELLGHIYSILGKLQKTLIYYGSYKDLMTQLHKDYPNDVDIKNGLAISYTKLGEINSSLGDFKIALTYFEQRSELGKQLCEAYPDNVNFKNGLAISYEKLGETQKALGNLGQAFTNFEKRYELGKQLYEVYPANAGFKNGFAIACQYLGVMHETFKDFKKALNYFEKYNFLEEQLHTAYPNNVHYKNLLAISCQYLGSVYNSLGNLEKALTYLEKFNYLEKQLFSSFPDNTRFKYNLAISNLLLGSFYFDKNNLSKARPYFNISSELLKELIENSPHSIHYRQKLAEVEWKLSQI